MSTEPCSICLSEDYKYYVMYNCNHFNCGKCYQKLYKNWTESKSITLLKCPMCRSIIDLYNIEIKTNLNELDYDFVFEDMYYENIYDDIVIMSKDESFNMVFDIHIIRKLKIDFRILPEFEIKLFVNSNHGYRIYKIEGKLYHAVFF